MEAIDILAHLRDDINDYFLKKKNVSAPAFLERFSEFSHLLTSEQKGVFAQLAQDIGTLPNVNDLTARVNESTAHKERTADEIGSKHIDNDKAALEKLQHVDWEEKGVFVDKFHKNIITMIEGLVKHLKESRDELTKSEIKASEDFAIFQTNMERENQHLADTISTLKKTIDDLSNQN